jgi:Phospholipase_D-nuclease N-terminal
MNIPLFNTNPNDLPWTFIILSGIAWLAILFRILSRPDFKTNEKLLWVIIVIFVPFFGMFLYAFAAPDAVASRTRKRHPQTKPPGAIIPGSDVSGTPWAKNPNYTNES